MKNFSILFISFFLAFNLTAQGDGEYLELQTDVNGLTRDYTLYVPQGHDGTEAWPLVFLFHGFSASIEGQIEIAQMFPVADTAKFFLVYPRGMMVEDLIFVGFDPAPGWAVPINYAPLEGQDDVAFTNKLIDDFLAHPSYNVDAARIHVTGFSNGAEMSNYLGCVLSDRIASVAPVAGPISNALIQDHCVPTRGISTFNILGTDDFFFPWNGDSIYTSLEETANFWGTNAGCDLNPTSIDLEDIDPNDNSTVTAFHYQNCNEDLEVVSYLIHGGGHTWPGGGFHSAWLGQLNNDFSASSEIWNFFQRNPHPNPPGEIVERTFMHNDSLRSYKVYVPSTYDGTEDWPLVINYHGFQNTADDQMYVSGMNAVADTGHFLVVYPQGLTIFNPGPMVFDLGWNVGGGLSSNDDLDFTAQMLQFIEADYAVDRAQVFVTGWSLGASMAYDAICFLNDKIASIGVVSNQMATFQMDACNPNRPIASLTMHGTGDPIIPFGGDGNFFDEAAATPEFWANNNNCSTNSSTTPLDDIDPNDGSTVSIMEYADCDNDAEVLFYVIEDGGHNWPGGGLLPPFLGNLNNDINASSEIWDFFKRNPHPNPPGIIEEHSFIHDDSLRGYKIYVPSAYDGSEEWPVVVSYHGFDNTPEMHMAITKMNEVADTGHFLVAYPIGLLVANPVAGYTAPGWNDDGTISDNDDISYSVAVLEHIKENYAIEECAVYMHGWSMGTSMALTMQCEYPDIVASVGVVAAEMADYLRGICDPNRPVSVLYMKGTDDPFIPYLPDPMHPVFTAGFQASVDFWVDRNNCIDAPTVTNLDDTDPSDMTNITLTHYEDCEKETEIMAYVINGGGHIYPSTNFLPPFFGFTNFDIDASPLIWDFFQRNKRPEVSNTNNWSVDPSLNLNLFPNPTSDNLLVEFNLRENSAVNMSITNLLGQTVHQIQYENLGVGKHQMNWTLEDLNLSNGTYYLKIETEYGIQAKSLIIQTR